MRCCYRHRTTNNVEAFLWENGKVIATSHKTAKTESGAHKLGKALLAREIKKREKVDDTTG